MAISALDFSGCSNRYGFAASSERAAGALRKLADDIESGEVLLQSVRVTGLVQVDDYAKTGIRIVVAEKLAK